jgi:hypothetical protein
MALKLITADERLSEAANKVTMAIFGAAGMGKTSLLHTLPPEDTLFLDLEAGMKSVQTWRGTSISLRSWEDATDIACLIGGVNPSRSSDETYSEQHYNYVMEQYGKDIDIPKYRTIFVDSISELTRIAMAWAQKQPAAFSEKTGKPDARNAFGLMGREVERLLKHIQHAPGKNAIFVGGLEKKVDDYNRETWELQTEGAKTGAVLPFIVDQVITMSMFDYDESGWHHVPGKGEYRALVCKTPNPWNLLAKDRSGNLEMIEEPHLGKLMDKINRPARPSDERLSISLPTSA